jgi:hypothetical protein
MGVAVRTVVVHAGPTRRPWEDAVHVLGEIRQIEPREVEHRIALEERP